MKTALQEFLDQIILKQVKGSAYLLPAITDIQIQEALKKEQTQMHHSKRQEGKEIETEVCESCEKIFPADIMEFANPEDTTLFCPGCKTQAMIEMYKFFTLLYPVQFKIYQNYIEEGLTEEEIREKLAEEDGVWFYVSKKVPANEQRVLVHGKDNKHKIYIYYSEGIPGWNLESGQEDDNDPIIKWKPLPTIS